VVKFTATIHLSSAVKFTVFAKVQSSDGELRIHRADYVEVTAGGWWNPPDSLVESTA
jgi:hypothetical protein